MSEMFLPNIVKIC